MEGEGWRDGEREGGTEGEREGESEGGREGGRYITIMEVIAYKLLTLGAHAQRGLRYLVRVCVCVCVCPLHFGHYE